MSKLAQKVAKFNGLPDSECFSSHSFRRSGATALVNAGATTDQLMVSGGWDSDRVARGYIQECDLTASNRSGLMLRSHSYVDPGSSSSSRNDIHVHVHVGKSDVKDD